MDNSGRGPLRVPGFGDIPLEEELECEERFAHTIREWQQIPAVTVRELAMVAVMNNLTDKSDWHIDIFNQDIVSGWRQEAFESAPLMSERAWVWCIDELRDKADEYKQKQYLRVLDTGSCVCKSDTIVPIALGDELTSGIEPLLKHQNVRDQISSLVDPSLYPLVYGRSLVLVDGGRVELGDIFGSYEKAKTAPTHVDRRADSQTIQDYIERVRVEPWRDAFSQSNQSLSSIIAYFWSYNFQWLPTEVEFIGRSGTDVQITSYVNNLHPAEKSLYRNLEKLISLAIRPWNDCLIKGKRNWGDSEKPSYEDNNRKQRGPVPLRIITYGVEWEDELPEWALAFDTVRRFRLDKYLKLEEQLRSIQDSPDGPDKKKCLQEAERKVELYSDMKGVHAILEPSPEMWAMAQEYLQRPDNGSTVSSVIPEDWKKNAWRLLKQKHKSLLRFKHPEPGTAFSYDEWKSSTNNGRAVVDMVTKRPGDPRHSPTNSDHEPYTIRLEDAFRRQGLQVIIKIGGIELTPENPSYDGGTWELEGQMNEHIVAAAIYAYDVQNITESRISFRQETSIDSNYYQYGPYLYQQSKGFIQWNEPAHRWGKSSVEVEAIGEILGFKWEELSRDSFNHILPFQEIGSIAMPQGRLITFPNVMEHRSESFELLDPTVPGHHRCVTLLLVDPHYRVCSTRNVPPQQEDWRTASTSDALMDRGSPGEVGSDRGPMSAAEADGYKRDLIKEHKWMQMARYNRMHPYSFA